MLRAGAKNKDGIDSGIVNIKEHPNEEDIYNDDNDDDDDSDDNDIIWFNN